MHSGRGYKAMICPFSFGVAWAIVFAVFMMIPAWMAVYNGTTNEWVTQMSHLYPGYEGTVRGAWMGGLWGLLEGFLLGFFIALIYDAVVCCCYRKKGACCKKSGCGCNCSCCNGNACRCGCGCSRCGCCTPANNMTGMSGTPTV